MRTFHAICFALLLFNCSWANAQQNPKDSLLNLIQNSAADTNRVMHLLKLADLFEANHQDSARYYLANAKKLADKLNFIKGKYEFFAQSVIVSFTVGDYEAALLQSNEALKLARQMNDSDRIINTLGNTGIIYQYTGDFEQQLHYSLLTQDILEKRKDSAKLVSMYHNTANAYANLNQHRKSANLCLSALTIAKNQPKPSYINRIYATLGQAYYEMDMIDSAIFHFNTSLAQSKINADTYAEAIVNGYLANAYAARQDFFKMLRVADEGLKISRTLQSNQSLASALYNAAFAHFYNGQNAIARTLITEGIGIATRDSLKDEMRNSYTVLSYIAARDGNFAESAIAKKKADSVNEAMLNETVLAKTTELEKKYEIVRKNAQLQQQHFDLQRKNIINYSLAGALCSFLLVGFLARRSYRHKQKIQQQRILELEKEKQLNAAAAVLKGEEQERRRLAKDLHDGLGGMLSGIKFSLQHMQQNLPQDAQPNLHRSLDMLDSSISEMRRVAHNMMPEALLRFGLENALKDYCNSIDQFGQLHVVYQSSGLEHLKDDTSLTITIYRLVQELVNNITKHANAKNALVQVSLLDEKLSITVEDDGIGFETTKMHEQQGIGWANILSRVAFWGGQVDVQSKIGEGASVLIELPAANETKA